MPFTVKIKIPIYSKKFSKGVDKNESRSHKHFIVENSFSILFLYCIYHNDIKIKRSKIISYKTTFDYSGIS